jgi:hypothetical protein
MNKGQSHSGLKILYCTVPKTCLRPHTVVFEFGHGMHVHIIRSASCMTRTQSRVGDVFQVIVETTETVTQSGVQDTVDVERTFRGRMQV